jgi:hypothetical protein
MSIVRGNLAKARGSVNLDLPARSGRQRGCMKGFQAFGPPVGDEAQGSGEVQFAAEFARHRDFMGLGVRPAFRLEERNENGGKDDAEAVALP